ncbi:MAG: hypothetical protein WKF64_06650, partial [Ilumatobacteraceae bacterium]
MAGGSVDGGGVVGAAVVGAAVGATVVAGAVDGNPVDGADVVGASVSTPEGGPDPAPPRRGSLAFGSPPPTSSPFPP